MLPYVSNARLVTIDILAYKRYVRLIPPRLGGWSPAHHKRFPAASSSRLGMVCVKASHA